MKTTLTEQELESHGWRKDSKMGGCMVWRDPLNLLSYYTFRDAVIVQLRQMRMERERAERLKSDND